MLLRYVDPAGKIKTVVGTGEQRGLNGDGVVRDCRPR